jgi:hypothetical protein
VLTIDDTAAVESDAPSVFERFACLFDRQRRARYLTLIARGRRPMLAARDVGVSYAVMQDRLAHDPFFARQFAMAQEEALQRIEQALIDKAREGNVRAAAYVLRNLRPDGSRHLCDSAVATPPTTPAAVSPIRPTAELERALALIPSGDVPARKAVVVAYIHYAEARGAFLIDPSVEDPGQFMP